MAKDNHLFYIILLCLTFAGISTISFTRYHVPLWDESVYMGMGKFLYSGGGSGLWEPIRPLGLPLITGLFWKMHTSQILWTEIIEIIFSVCLIVATYALASKLFNKNIALTAALLLAITPIFMINSSMIMTEIISTLFVVLAVYFYVDGRYILSGLSSGLAFLFRFPQALIFIALLLMMIYEYFTQRKPVKEINSNSIYRNIRIRKIFYFIIAFLVMVAPYFVFNAIYYHYYTNNAVHAMFNPVIMASAHQNNAFEGISVATSSYFFNSAYNIFYYFFVAFYNDPLLLLFIVGIIYCLIDFRSKRTFSNYKSSENNRLSLIIVLIIYLVYFSAITIKQDRFIIMMLPFISILSAYVISSIIDYYGKKNIFMHLLAAAFASLMILMTFYGVGSYNIYLQSQPDSKPVIIDSLYRYFDIHNIPGPILTTDPVFSYYSDKRFIAYYDSVGADYYMNEWESKIRYDAAAFSEQHLPCLPGDARCLDGRKKILSDFMINYDMVLNRTYTTDYQQYPIYVFVKK